MWGVFGWTDGVKIEGARGFVPLEGGMGQGLGMRVLALLEMAGDHEGKKGDLPGKGDSMSKGVAEADGIQSSGAPCGMSGTQRGAGGMSRGLGYGLSSWRWLGVMEPLKDFAQGSVGVTAACTKSTARCQLSDQAVESYIWVQMLALNS